MRADIALPLVTADFAGALTASFNHGLSNGSTFYNTPTITSVFGILITKMVTNDHFAQ